MTNTEITPELLRSVATWLRDNTVGALPGKPMAAEFLDGAADDLEREQTDEKRIDELARISYEAGNDYIAADTGSAVIDRDEADEFQRGITRAGIRAVLDKLRIDSYTSPCDGKCGDDSPHNAHLTPEGRRHFLAAPRKWARIGDVPGDVDVVRNAYLDRLRRDPETTYGWRFTWDDGGDRAPVPRSSIAEHGPFTEVIADA